MISTTKESVVTSKTAWGMLLGAPRKIKNLKKTSPCQQCVLLQVFLPKRRVQQNPIELQDRPKDSLHADA